MNRMTVGNVYQASFALSGNSSKGPYEILKVTDERGKDEITLFVNPASMPTNIAKGDRFRLNKITEISHYWKKGQVYNKEKKCKEEGWEERYEFNVEVKRLDNDLPEMDATEFGDDFGGQLPWEDPDNELPL